ncbi:MAG: serine hydrolase [Gammaproteobacteria bacterium]
MRLLKWLLAVAAALPLLALATLYVTEPVVAQRYLSLFTAAADDFEALRPRVPLNGAAPLILPVAAPGDRLISPAGLTAMQEYAAAQDSWALVVVQDGRIQAEWYAEGWNRQRLAQSQSMHKSILPVLLQAAVEDGYIDSLTDPFGKYVVEWRDDPRGQITIEQMLWMSSGLLEYPFSLNPFSDAFRWLFGSDITPVLLRTPLDWEPGARFNYNNVNSELLGLLLERSTGNTYAEYLAKRLWEPMGGADAELWLDSAGGKAHSSCCLLAAAMDWAKFGMLLLGRGEIDGRRIVSADFVDRMVTASPTFDWYGYHIWLGYSRALNPRASKLEGGYQRTDPFDAEDTFYTSGFGAQRVYVVPSAGLVIVRMGPATGRAPVRESWDNTYLVNTALRNQLSRQEQLAGNL